MHADSVTRDDVGRLLAADGFPLGGLATVREVVAATSLSRSKIYAMIDAGEIPVRHFGRSIRVPWSCVRAQFLGDEI